MKTTLAAPILCLIGFMGAGKTSVGKALAERLNLPFLDLDDMIETNQRLSIPQIFSERGEAAFRQAETQALQQACLEIRKEPFVLAVGGGAFARKENQELLCDARARTIFLRASVDELWTRCKIADSHAKRGRPLLSDRADFEKRLTERTPLYEQADLIMQTDGRSVLEVASAIESTLALFSKESSGDSCSLK